MNKLKLATAHGQLYCNYKVSPTLYETDVRISNHAAAEGNIFKPSITPRIRLARPKFELTNQDSGGGKKLAVLYCQRNLTGAALKSGSVSHQRLH